MALFVDLDEDEPPQGVASKHPVWNGEGSRVGDGSIKKDHGTSTANGGARREEAHEPTPLENPNRNSMTVALGCYP